jgi:integrase
MAGRRAELLNDTQVKACLRWCDERRRYPHRDRVVVLLSVRAGLRAVEIARLRRGHVMDEGGGIADVINLQGKFRIAKKGPGRVIPMHADLREQVIRLFGIVPGGPDDPLILSERAMRPNPEDPEDRRLVCMAPNSIVLMFGQMYGELGLAGCSSHSGRRTFITKVAGKITEAGGSLRDVQQLAGHTSLNTTQRYVDGSDEAKRRVMKLL